MVSHWVFCEEYGKIIFVFHNRKSVCWGTEGEGDLDNVLLILSTLEWNTQELFKIRFLTYISMYDKTHYNKKNNNKKKKDMISDLKAAHLSWNVFTKHFH